MKDCRIGSCKGPRVARGLCKTHYDRWWRSGSARPSEPVRTYTPRGSTLAEQMAAHVDRRAGPGRCYGWRGATVQGYGSLRVDGKVLLAHRVAWELKHGPVPEGMQVLHRCDYRPCTNDAHLFIGTQADNMADMAAKGRGWWQQ